MDCNICKHAIDANTIKSTYVCYLKIKTGKFIIKEKYIKGTRTLITPEWCPLENRISKYEFITNVL